MTEPIPTLRDIAETIVTLRSERDALVAQASATELEPDNAIRLAEIETSVSRFDAACSFHKPVCLMSLGLVWDDVLTHPALPESIVRVRLSDRVLFEGVEMTLLEATRLVAKQANKSVALQDWHSDRIDMEEALGLAPRTGRTDALTKPAADASAPAPVIHGEQIGLLI